MKFTRYKKLLIFIPLLLILAVCSVPASASDYKYKVLDTKYNPGAQKLIDGELDVPVEDVVNHEKKRFDFGRFFALLAMILFPSSVLVGSVKTFNKVTIAMQNKENYLEPEENENDDSVVENNIDENSKLDVQSTSETAVCKEIAVKQELVTIKNVEKNTLKTNPIVQSTPDKKSENTSIEKVCEKKESETLKKQDNSASSKNSSVRNSEQEEPNKEFKKNKIDITEETKCVLQSLKATNPNLSPVLNKNNPILLNTAVLSDNKGLCIVEYKKKFSLIGYINEKIFLLNQFDKLRNAEIRPRYTETVKDKDRYIVRLGTAYKALIEVDENDISLLIEL